MACGGRFELSNACKMASVMGGMLGMALGNVLSFSNGSVSAGHGSKMAIVEGIAAAALTVGLAATTAARLTLQLEPKR